MASELAPDVVETRKEFSREHEKGLRGFNEQDQEALMGYLGVGMEKTKLKQAMGIGLLSLAKEFYQDSQKGLPREEVLLLACLLDRRGSWQDIQPEEFNSIRQGIVDKLGGEERAEKVFTSDMEPIDEKNPDLSWRLSWNGEMGRPIHTEVEAAVDEYLAEREKPAEVPTPEPAPAGDGWGDEQKQAAAEFYKKLKDQEKNKVDALARAILDSGSEPEMVEAVINSLPNTRKLIDVSGRKEDVDWIIEKQTPRVQGKDKIADALKQVLLLKKLTSENAREKAIDPNWEFYDALADTLRWRVEGIREQTRKENEAAAKKKEVETRLGQLELVAGKSGDSEKGPVLIGEEVKQLLTNAADLKITLPSESITALVNDGKIGRIQLNLHGGYSAVEVVEFKGKLVRFIAGMPEREMNGLGKYTVKADGEVGAAVYEGGRLVAKFGKDGSGDLLTMQWETGVGLEEGLLITALVAGQFDPDFPGLKLGLKGVVELPPEPAPPPDGEKSFSPQEALKLVDLRPGPVSANTLLNLQKIMGKETAGALAAAIAAEYAELNSESGFKIIGDYIGRARLAALEVTARKMGEFSVAEKAFIAAFDQSYIESPQEFKQAVLAYHLAIRLLSIQSGAVIEDRELQGVVTRLLQIKPIDNLNQDEILGRVRELVQRTKQVEAAMNEKVVLAREEAGVAEEPVELAAAVPAAKRDFRKKPL